MNDRMFAGWKWLLVALLLLRIGSLALYPLADPTEGRYGEIARKMYRSGRMLMPETLVSSSMEKKAAYMLEKYATTREGGGAVAPFWAKPPLSSWFSVLGMKLFGDNTFGVRMGSVLSFLPAIVAFGFWRQKPGRFFAVEQFVFASVVMLGCVLGFVAAGAVMTDMALAMGLLWCMVGLGNVLVEPNSSRRYKYLWTLLAALGAAAAVLAKGPLALVLLSASMSLWLVASRSWSSLLKLPWWLFASVFALVVVPWFVLAEQATPGYLDYFIMGEHVQRFLHPGWQGDFYGAGHASTRGVIWLYALAGCCPWLPLLLWQLLAKCPSCSKFSGLRCLQGLLLQCRQHPSACWLLSWVLAPLLFFSLSRNILPAYALPVLAPFALICAAWLREKFYTRTMLVIAWAWPVCIVLAAVIAKTAFAEKIQQSSAAAILDYYQQQDSSAVPLLVVGDVPYSLEFYSKGQFILVRGREQVTRAFADDKLKFALVAKNSEKQLREWLGAGADNWQRATQSSNGAQVPVKSKDSYLWQRK